MIVIKNLSKAYKFVNYEVDNLLHRNIFTQW